MTRGIVRDGEVRLRPGRMKTASIQGAAADRQEILPLLTRLHHESRAHLDRLRSQVVSGAMVGVNAKGDPQRHFDVAVDQWDRRWLTEHYDAGIVVSEEETEALQFGNEQDGYRFVVDPVDGSLARTLEGCAGVRAYGCASRARSLQDPTTLVAASTRELAEEIIDAIAQ